MRREQVFSEAQETFGDPETEVKKQPAGSEVDHKDRRHRRRVPPAGRGGGGGVGPIVAFLEMEIVPRRCWLNHASRLNVSGSGNVLSTTGGASAGASVGLGFLMAAAPAPGERP